MPDSTCSEDVAGYRIYYKLKNDENLALLQEISGNSTFTYRHTPGDVIAGCYAVSAFDINGNVGNKSITFCIDSCDFYEIPNVFTPNGDDINDRLVAKTSGLVETIDFKLFNRNGLLIFSTSNPRIDWDGTYNGKIVSPGVYFYSCDVYETRLSGLELFHLSGFVHVITEKGAGVTHEVTK
jgi:gliding motility-associated-like protein